MGSGAMSSPPPGMDTDRGYDIGGNLTSALVIGAAAILCTFALVVFYFVRYIWIGRQLREGEVASNQCNQSDENKAMVLKELPVLSWNELVGKKKVKGDETCSVCLGDFGIEDPDGSGDTKLRLLPRCGHCFHSQCVDGWLNEHSLCPVCRGCWVPADIKAAAALLSGRLEASGSRNSGWNSGSRAEVVEELQHVVINIEGGGGGGGGLSSEAEASK